MNALNADHKLIGFVPFMNKAMREGNPNLKNMWEIILFIQENLRLPASAEFEGVAVVRDLDSIRNKIKWPADHDHFARWAYEYLRFAHEIGASEQAIKTIAHTKPNVRADALAGINAHELSLSRKVHKGDQVADRTYVQRMRSEAEFWVHDKILCHYTKKTVPQTARYDIPIWARDETYYIKQMVEAMIDMNGPKDGSDAQIDTVRKMSMTVAQHLAWHLLIKSRHAQRGDPFIQPFCTNFYLKEYAHWYERWNDMLKLMRKSKAAVVDLAITTYAKRFATDPTWELTRKEHNARDNNNRARREKERRESLIVQQQAPVRQQMQQGQASGQAHGSNQAQASGSGHDQVYNQAQAYNHGQVSAPGPVYSSGHGHASGHGRRGNQSHASGQGHGFGQGYSLN